MFNLVSFYIRKMIFFVQLHATLNWPLRPIDIVLQGQISFLFLKGASQSLQRMRGVCLHFFVCGQMWLNVPQNCGSCICRWCTPSSSVIRSHWRIANLSLISVHPCVPYVMVFVIDSRNESGVNQGSAQSAEWTKCQKISRLPHARGESRTGRRMGWP